MVVCSVPGCAGKGAKMFHSFPKNAAVREIWIKNTKTSHLTTKQLDSYAKVCKYHFRETDFETNARGQEGLKKNAVPSVDLPTDSTLGGDSLYALTSEDQYVPRKRQRKQQLVEPTNAFDDPLSNPQNHEALVDLNDFGTDLHEVVLVDPNQFVTVNVAQIKELQKTADDCKVYEQKNKENESIISEMQRREKQNQLLISKLLKNDQVNQKKIKKLRQELRDAKSTKKKNVMKYLSGIFNAEQLAFFSMQLKNSGKKSKGRRYTAEEKSLAFILYKHSPKNYKEMRKMFILPDKRTLGRFSAKLVFNAGIDTKLFAHMTEKVKSLSELDTFCTLLWDEVSLHAHSDYSIYRDEIDGFVDMLGVRRPDFATHALTFMVRGINTPFKQPIAFFFTNGLKHYELTEIIKLVSKAVFDTGLKIMVSMCDQVSVNVKAIHALMSPNCAKSSNGGLLTYEIHGSTVIHCFDPPHLIKGIRNNLMTKTLKHRITKRWSLSGIDPNKKVKRQSVRSAKWDHVESLYRLNLQGSTKLLPKITAEHIDPKRLKMKVNVATQVFSETCGRMMLKYADGQILPKSHSDTGEVLLFFNDLFDSMNGSSVHEAKSLKGPVNVNSNHFAFWEYALSVLSDMNFYDKSSGKLTNRTSVLKHFQSTIKGFMEICRKCFLLNMKDISLRNLNQDALENYFGCVRSCQNSSSLIAMHFRAAYGTTFFKNLSSAHSIKSNCEADTSTPLLTNLKSFFLNYDNVETSVELSANDSDTDDDVDDDRMMFDPLHNFSNSDIDFVTSDAIANVCGSVCDKMIKITKCIDCRKTFETANDQYDSETRKEPSDILKNNFQKLVNVVNDVLPIICVEKCLRKRLLEQFDKIEIEEMGCIEHHDLVEFKFKEHTAFYGIVTFTKNINDLLNGKIKILPKSFNYLEELAHSFNKKKRAIGKHSDIFKAN